MKDVWLENSMRIQKFTSDEDGFLNLFEKLLGRLENEEIEMFAYVARQVWFRRNKVVFGEDLLSPATVNRIALEQMDLFLVN